MQVLKLSVQCSFVQAVAAVYGIYKVYQTHLFCLLSIADVHVELYSKYSYVRDSFEVCTLYVHFR